MTAGLESAGDTRSYNSPSLVGNIVEKVLIARQLAENERKFAEKKAFEAGTSLEEIGVEKGFFFKNALRGEFGGNFIDKKTKQLKGVVRKYKIAKRISKNPKVAFNFIKPILAAKTKRKVSGAQTKMFRAKFDYTNYDEVTTAVPKTPVAGTAAKKIQKATTSKSKRISREEILSAITDIANSLNKTAESIGKSTAGVSASFISSTNAQMQLAEQLKVRNTTLEDKLNEIAKAIADQTQFQKQSVGRTKAARAEDKLENQTDVALTETPDDTETAVNETLIAQLTTPTSPITNVQNISSSVGATSSQNIEHQQTNAYNNIPEAETGGIISGPNSGYLAKLHGDELVVPLNNNYTEGKKSAVDGRVRRRPSSTGGVKTSSVGGRFGFGITNMTGIASGGSTQASAMSQPLVDAMSLIPMASGGSALALVTELMNTMGKESSIIQPEIQQMSRSIANVFGLPSAIVNKIRSKSKTTGQEATKKEDDGMSDRDIFAKMSEGFTKLLEKLREGINTPPPPPPGDTDFNNNAPVADVSKDTEFLAEVHKLAGETGTTPSELMSLFNAESKLDPKARNDSGATGLFQLMYGGKFGDVRYGKTRDEFSALSRADQVRAYRKYITEAGFFKKGGRGLADLKTANIAPAFLGEPSDTPMYRRGSAEYEKNKNVDIMYGNNDGVLDANDYAAFVKKTGQEEKFRKYNDPSYATAQPPPPAAPKLPPSPLDLGRRITNNYGLKVGEERTFTVPGYGEVKAHKTRVGFDFYDGGTKLDMSKPQGKAIIEYFESTNGGQDITLSSINAPAAQKDKVEKAETMATPLSDSGSGNNVAMMLPQGQQKQTAFTALPSSAETSTTGRSFDPLSNSGLYNNNVLA